MNNFRITFLALSRSLDFIIDSKQEIDEIINDIIMVFAKDIDYENQKINIESLQQNTTEFKSKIDSVVQKYKSFDQKIQQLNTYFNDLKEDEHFFIFPNSILPKEESFQFYNYLSALDKNEDFETLTNQIDELFGELKEKYEMFAFDENTRNKIGESDKSKRVCRFCSKRSDEVKFKKIAHSISEALGNKKIITNDECDSCNEKFGTGIENDLILYLNLYRNIFGIKGKNGIPKLKGKNFEMENNGTITIKHYSTDEEINDENTDDFKVKLETSQELTAQNIYRTLSKYALSVIDQKYLEYFEDTIKWINSEISLDTLPKVAMLTSYSLFSHHPKIMLYIRKNDDFELPFAVAEFRFTFLTFAFIIPKSSNDKIEFTDANDYKVFWNFFKHYNSITNWTFMKMDDNMPRKFTMNLNFEPKQKK
ncbi:HNH endonuclease [Flavobacterium sp. GP15]|uniref:HNH endonuclease n=1 Tax=Flavobacterium sp. GP15 TaxID=2758567 RepID=UPI00165E475B|nr:HNH endonuclease [Flavobacterium sp. GP15]